MTEADKLARRIRLAIAMGIAVNGQVNGVPCIFTLENGAVTNKPLPNFDTDAQAREDLLEWFLSNWYSLEIHPTHEGTSVKVIYDKEIVNKEADTCAESLLSAIDAAIQARGKEQ